MRKLIVALSTLPVMLAVAHANPLARVNLGEMQISGMSLPTVSGGFITPMGRGFAGRVQVSLAGRGSSEAHAAKVEVYSPALRFQTAKVWGTAALGDVGYSGPSMSSAQSLYALVGVRAAVPLARMVQLTVSGGVGRSFYGSLNNDPLVHTGALVANGGTPEVFGGGFAKRVAVSVSYRMTSRLRLVARESYLDLPVSSGRITDRSISLGVAYKL